ncbi:metallophosphoesterase [Candidatus Leptofilum sp.]|uniref:metallophosphoesterase n=1 Tax=Candidatus Leptofilum sp. TaxID=3241576 RepID=UPI003B5C2F76
MSRYQRIFVSDVHLSSQRLYDSKKAWYDSNNHRNRFLSFLDNQVLVKSKQVKDLILLGDLFDNWVCPADEEPPTFNEILAANPKELERLRKAINLGIKVFFVHGNHDYTLPKSLLEKEVPGLKVITAYKGAGRTHAEHGHLCTLFNRPDYLNDPAYGRPLGYYISRLHTSSNHAGFSFADIVFALDDVLEAAVTSATMIESLIEALAERANNVTEIMMPGGQIKTIDEIKKQYRDLPTQQGHSLLSLRTAIRELELGFHADQLCRDFGFNVVLFGHTHHKKIDKDFLFVEDRIYANTGTWCDKNASCVIVEKYPLKSGISVKLVDVDLNGSITNTRTRRL